MQRRGLKADDAEHAEGEDQDPDQRFEEIGATLPTRDDGSASHG
jgi:hypothetical protein